MPLLIESSVAYQAFVVCKQRLIYLSVRNWICDHARDKALPSLCLPLSLFPILSSSSSSLWMHARVPAFPPSPPPPPPLPPSFHIFFDFSSFNWSKYTSHYLLLYQRFPPQTAPHTWRRHAGRLPMHVFECCDMRGSSPSSPRHLRQRRSRPLY